MTQMLKRRSVLMKVSEAIFIKFSKHVVPDLFPFCSAVQCQREVRGWRAVHDGAVLPAYTEHVRSLRARRRDSGQAPSRDRNGCSRAAAEDRPLVKLRLGA